MTTPSTDTPSIRERPDRLRPSVLEVAQRYGASNLRVFGSVALNQEHQDSDLDLLVDWQANQSLLALVGITQELERLLGCPVDVAEPDSLHPLIHDYLKVNLNRVRRIVENDLPPLGIAVRR
jgi:predicted nucleotidyltransferase